MKKRMISWRKAVGRFRYRNSPLIEALCEFGFAPSEWNSDLVSKLQLAYQGEFPLRQDLKTVHAQLAFNEAGVHQGVQQADRIQFLSPDKSCMVQVAPNTLTINDLHPYSGWDTFKPTILRALTIYRDIAGSSELLRSHLRYINQVDFDGPTVELDDWFEFSFREPQMDGLPGAHAYGVVARYPFPDHSLLRVQLDSMPSTGNNHLVALLDLEYISVGEKVVPVDRVDAWLDSSHSRIESAWLGCITEELHRKYEPEAIE